MGYPWGGGSDGAREHQGWEGALWEGVQVASLLQTRPALQELLRGQTWLSISVVGRGRSGQLVFGDN